MDPVRVLNKLTAKGLHLTIHDERLRVTPSAKLTNEDREQLNRYRSDLLVLLGSEETTNAESERSERCEHRKPLLKTLPSRNTHSSSNFSQISIKNNVHNVHNVHSMQDLEFNKLGDWYFSDNGFRDEEDYSVYDAGTVTSAIRTKEILDDLTWPDFKVTLDGSFVLLRRVEERYFPRKKKDESSQLNDESRKQE